MSDRRSMPVTEPQETSENPNSRTAIHIFDNPILLLGITGFLLASKIIVAKSATAAGVAPQVLALLSNLGAGLILLAVVRFKGLTIATDKFSLGMYFALGVFSFALPNTLAYAAVGRVGPSFTSTVYAFSPLITFAISIAVGLESLRLAKLLAVAVGLFGTALVVSSKVGLSEGSNAIWVFATLLLPLSAAIGNVIRSKYWPKGSSPLSFAAATLLASVVVLAIPAPFYWESAIQPMSSWGIFWTLVLTVGSSGYFFVLFRLQQIAGPVYLSQIGYWGSGFGLVLSALIFGDFISMAQGAGIVLIVLGALLLGRARAAHG